MKINKNDLHQYNFRIVIDRKIHPATFPSRSAPMTYENTLKFLKELITDESPTS